MFGHDNDSLSDGRSLQLSTFEGMLGDARRGDHDSLDPRREENIARTESKAVSVVKKLMIIMLVIVAVIGTVVTWSYTSNQETADFEDAFDGHARRLLDSFKVSTEQRIAAASSLSVTITSHVKNSQGRQVWPNVTVPDFQEHCAIPLHTVQANWISFAPVLLSLDDRIKWEAYAAENEALIADEQFATPAWYAQESGGHTGNFSEGNNDVPLLDQEHNNRTVADGIYRKDDMGRLIDDMTQGPYAPLWQVSPHRGNNKMQMFNLFDGGICQRGMDTMLWSQGVVLSEIMYGPNSTTPISFFMVPVFSNFSSHHIVGTVILEVDWRTYFEAALPKQAGDVMITVENTCGQIHSFKSVGDTVEYVDAKNSHDARFDSQNRTLSQESFHYLCDAVPFSYVYLNGYSTEEKVAPTETNDNQQYDPDYSLNASQCHYSVSVYPTSEFEAKFITQKPLGYTFFVIIIFIFTSSIFLLYDCIVERRQNKVMHIAVQAKSIVDSLFPHNVRDRVFRSAQPNGMEIAISGNGDGGIVGTANNNSCNNTKKMLLKRILVAGTTPGREMDSESGEPIADLFPHTTVVSVVDML